jgi:Spy/CpxP family protein refolding chaperone
MFNTLIVEDNSCLFVPFVAKKHASDFNSLLVSYLSGQLNVKLHQYTEIDCFILNLHHRFLSENNKLKYIMKKLFIAALSLALFTGVVAAQTKEHRDDHKQHHRHHKHHKRHHHRKGVAAVHFSDAQKAQAKNIAKDYHTKMTALRSNDNMTLGDFKKQRAALATQHKQDMKNLLTPEQKTQVAAAQQKRQEDRQVRSAAHIERMKIKLGLQDEQVAKIKEQRESFHKQAMAIRQDQTLQPEQKRAQMKALAQSQKNQFKSILTTEQQEKLNSLRTARTSTK